MMTTVRREHILLAPKNWVTVCELKKSKIKKKNVLAYIIYRKSPGTMLKDFLVSAVTNWTDSMQFSSHLM